ncbi:unnamed protein product [Mytilus edulis]|uniref:Uncharacterized protein n=1 Tax=Mytilus edulis TaxID=6550 RepID=A0A8S3VAB0_MYTED|nr:unnamed protein product [Mytilus edulis]
MSTADENNQTHSSEFSQNLCLKETLVRIEREINTLKGDYTQEIEYLNKTVSVLVRENKQLVNANQKNNDRLRNFQNQISSLRENNENLAKTVNNMSVVTHEAEMTCKSNKLAIEKSSGTFRNKLDEYENSIQQLTTDVNKIKNDFKTVKLDVNELRSSVKSESCRINQLSDTRAQGVVSLKTKTNIMSDKLKEFDDELKKVNIDCCSHAKSISDLRKRIINTEKDVKVLDKSTKSYADILKSKSEQVIASAEALDNCNVIESDLSQSKEPIQSRGVVPIQRNSINEHSNSLVDSHTKHVRSSDVTNLSVLVKDIHVQSNIVNPAPSTSIENKIKNTNNNITGNEQNTNIQVHFPTSMCNPTTVDNFRGFVKKTRHRVSRFYVGGIDKHNSCEESMREYLAARGVNDLPKVRYVHFNLLNEDGPKTGIDHIVTNNENTRDIYNVFVPDESIFNVSDHKPIACTLLIEQCHADSDNLYESVMADKVSWTKALETNSVNDYSFAVSQFLWSVQMPLLPATKEDIELYYKTIIVAVQKADKETLPHKQFVKHIKPYWTKVVDLSHKTMLNKRSLWILNGKVHDRSDQFFADYKHAKRTFRNEMDKAYNEHIMNIANRMEESIDNDQDMYGRS